MIADCSTNVWNRYDAQKPQCGFGEAGLCCRNCLQGPCRIDPHGEGPAVGVCGATADTMVARQFLEAVAIGTASHAAHARHLVAALEGMDIADIDRSKLKQVAARLQIDTDGRDNTDIVRDLVQVARSEFTDQQKWSLSVLPERRHAELRGAKLIPNFGIDAEIREALHRIHYGCDADPASLISAAIRLSIADLDACCMATELSDILFGVPQPVVASANIGVLKADAVNIALHGHSPRLSEAIIATAPKFENSARAAGATAGINLVGICCTGNEALMRQGINACASMLNQEAPMLTGAVDAMVTDYQCIMPSLTEVAKCTGTPVITTSDSAKIPGAQHLKFDENPEATVKKILMIATQNFKRRKGKVVHIPKAKTTSVAGFSVEALITALSRLDSDQPLKPLIDLIKSGHIRGIGLLAGCNNVKVKQDHNFIAMAEELLKKNILLVATGCGAGAFMRHGFMDPANVDRLCGETLAKVLHQIGEKNNLGGPLPPVLHMGSCVDNSRPVALAAALATAMDCDISDLPLVASAPEATTPKAMAIATYAMALGLPVHVGVPLPVGGSQNAMNLLRDDALTGGRLILEPVAENAAALLINIIDEHRIKLGLSQRRAAA